MEADEPGFRTPPQAGASPDDDERMHLTEEDLVPVSAEEVELAVGHLTQLGTRMIAIGERRDPPPAYKFDAAMLSRL